MKTCTKCMAAKPLKEFYPAKTRNVSRANCIACCLEAGRIKSREHYHRHKELKILAPDTQKKNIRESLLAIMSNGQFDCRLLTVNGEAFVDQWKPCLVRDVGEHQGLIEEGVVLFSNRAFTRKTDLPCPVQFNDGTFSLPLKGFTKQKLVYQLKMRGK